MSNWWSKTKIILPQLIGFLVVVLIVIFGTSFASRIGNKKDLEEIAEKKVTEIVKEKKIIVTRPKCENTFDDYLSLKKQGHIVQILKNKWSHAQGGGFTSNLEPTVIIGGKDEIACGYVYVKLSKKNGNNNNPLDENTESIYINPQGFGGHILRAKGISYSNDNGYTEALLPLSAISYLPNLPYDPNANDFRIADWVSLLSVNSHVTFSVGLSTLHQGGFIDEITIAYKCWDTETGELTSGCQLGMQN